MTSLAFERVHTRESKLNLSLNCFVLLALVPVLVLVVVSSPALVRSRSRSSRVQLAADRHLWSGLGVCRRQVANELGASKSTANLSIKVTH